MTFDTSKEATMKRAFDLKARIDKEYGYSLIEKRYNQYYENTLFSWIVSGCEYDSVEDMLVSFRSKVRKLK